MRVYRASSLPLGFACAEGLRGEEETKLLIPAADTGTAVHAALAAAVSQDDVEAADLTRYAQEYHIDQDELAALFFSGIKCWSELKKKFGKISTETRLTAGTPGKKGQEAMLVGHLDVYHAEKDGALILDWKSGRLDINYYHQLAAYAYLTMADCAPDRVTAYIVWLREGNYESYHFDRASLKAWGQRLMNEVIYAPEGQFTVGAHCRFCPRFTTCPGRTGMLRATANELLATPPVEGAIGYPFGELYDRVKVLKGAIEQFETCLRGEVGTAGGIDLDGKRRLELVEQDRESIVARKAWGILSREITVEQLAAACKITKGKVLEAVRAKAARGQKAKAVEKLMTELRAVGATQTNTIETLKEIRK